MTKLKITKKRGENKIKTKKKRVRSTLLVSSRPR